MTGFRDYIGNTYNTCLISNPSRKNARKTKQLLLLFYLKRYFLICYCLNLLGSLHLEFNLKVVCVIYSRDQWTPKASHG